MKVCCICGAMQDKKASLEKALKLNICTCGFDDPDGIWPELESFEDISDDGYETDEDSDYPSND